MANDTLPTIFQLINSIKNDSIERSVCPIRSIIFLVEDIISRENNAEKEKEIKRNTGEKCNRISFIVICRCRNRVCDDRSTVNLFIFFSSLGSRSRKVHRSLIIANLFFSTYSWHESRKAFLQATYNSRNGCPVLTICHSFVVQGLCSLAKHLLKKETLKH